MPKILLTHSPDAFRSHYGEQALAGLKALAEVRRNETGQPLDLERLIESARDCAIIVSDRQIAAPAELFDRLPELVAFCRCAVDIRTVDVAAASARGVLVTQASPSYMTATAEWVVGAMIDLARHISAASEAYHAGLMPGSPMGRELKGSTLGIIGYGRIGRRLAEIALLLGMRVVVTDPHVKVSEPPLEQVAFERLLAESDFVVCLAAATPETENLIDAHALARMKPAAYFINASRGDLVDETALEHALGHGVIAGCALDVGRARDQKPTPSLARHPKVIATPHTGGLTPPAIEHQAMETVAQVAEILQGRAPVGAVNVGTATRLGRLERA